MTAETRRHGASPTGPGGRGERTAPAIITLIAGAAVTVLAVWSLHAYRRTAAIAFGLVLLTIVVLAAWRRLQRQPVDRVLRALALLVVLAALLGPALALPQFRQVFAFRVLLAALIVGCLTWALLERPTLRIAPLSLIVWLAAWLGWLGLSGLWAPDKAAALRYLTLIAFMVVVLAATAYQGTTRDRLRRLLIVLALALALNLAVAVLEGTIGFHLPSSSRWGTRSRDTTGFFVNPNDLATYLAICVPFLLVGLFATSRWLLRATAILGLLLSAYALVHTGSRSALVAIAFETLLVVVVLPARGTVRHRVAVVVLGVALLTGVGVLALNASQSPLLNRFQLATVTQQVEAGSGSGGSRVALLRLGWRLALHYDFAGAGPGNAEGLIRQQPDRPGDLVNLHNWWMEVLVNGGLPSLVFYTLFFVGLIVALWRVGRGAGDDHLRLLALAAAIGTAGYAIGCWGPSSAFDFSPMWVLFGLGLAVVLRAQRLEEEQLGHSGRRSPRREAA